MKFKLTFIISLFISLASTAQVTPVLREYRCDFLRDSTLWLYSWVTGIGGKLVPVAGHKFAEGDGGLYNAVYRKANGDVYIIEGQSIAPRFLQYDTLGIPFKAIAVESHLQTNIAVRLDGTIWISGHDTGKWLTTDANRKMNRWAKIPGQPAVKFAHVTKGGANGNGVLVATTETGEVWTVNDGSTSWTKKSLPGPAQQVYASESNFYIALIDGAPYGWGQARYLTGITGMVSGYIALAPYWGIQKVKGIAVNGQTVHIIDSDHRLWGYGDNAMGEVGVGWELVNRREIYKGKQYVWGWVTAIMAAYQEEAFISKPVRIAPDKLFSRVYGGGYYSFYKFAQDVSGNLYSWGRNKSGVLCNGRAIGNESDLPNWGDVTKPEMVNLNFVIPLPGQFIPGTVSAGKDMLITGNAFTLVGSAVGSRSSNFTYHITNMEWTQMSGPECKVWYTGTGIINVTDAREGTYTFKLLATDDQGGTMADTVVVNVTIPNKPPTAEAFCSKVVIGNSIVIVGKATDPDGKITATEWDKISGPYGDILTDISEDDIEITFAAPGEYKYRFSAFDDKGASSWVDITLIVYAVEGGSFIIIRKF